MITHNWQIESLETLARFETTGFRRIQIGGLAMIIALLMMAAYFTPHIWQHGEAREALVIQDIVHHNHWLLPMRNGQLAVVGKLGREVSLADGVEAAKVAMLNALAIAKQELGSLDRITRVVKVVGHVASAEGFTDQPQVLNGASDLLVAIFGEAGRHARVATGAAELPRRAAVEIEVILAVS